jgi:hypothetical protein
MSPSTQLAFAIGAVALVAYVIFAGVHDAALILLRPVAPYFAFMSP